MTGSKAAFAVLGLIFTAIPAYCQTIYSWNLTTGGSWATSTNWTPTTGLGTTFPSQPGDGATFNANATANRAITLDGAWIIGSLSFDMNGTFTNTINTGSGGPLTFNTGTVGVDAVITTMGTGTGNNTISVAMVLTSNVIANVNNTTATSAAGSLNLTGTMTGAGGFTKNGDGLATFGTGAKTYTGATVLNGGRTRMSILARPQSTSGFTINAGAQLTLIAAGSYTFGNGILTLNGSGAASGPYAQFPGAIRNDTNLAATITNAVVLQSDSLLHVQGNSTGLLAFTNGISGPGSLSFTAPNSDVNQGVLRFDAANSYAGGTLIRGGTLLLNTSVANLGTGNVTVDNATSTASTAMLNISVAGGNAIDDAAALNIGSVISQGKVNLGDGVNEVVGSLTFGGTIGAPGMTYGSTSSPAIVQNDTYFSGNGIITVAVVPEPSALLALAGILVLRRQRRID